MGSPGRSPARHGSRGACRRIRSRALLSERLSLTDVARLTGLDLSTVRRLRHTVPRESNLETGR
ncbi:hypothetical protein D0Z08_01330 [Nocardioides immobilis]|uniref:HTH iclR-type domain-containing protein n=1 Tax=Nocardioides immobilis TaxID=2049295 RepID=A0A417Y721_9ACTN|nr:hypothetical protein D0Z08_01330 [Nocardioides immobilis]